MLTNSSTQHSLLNMSRPTFLDRIDRAAPAVFLLPAVLIVLLMSIFPLVLSIYLSMSRLRFEAGKTVLDFVGFDNYAKFLFGNEQSVLIGTLSTPTWVGWLFLAAAMAWAVYSLIRSARVEGIGGLLSNLLNTLLLFGLIYLAISTIFSQSGRPGALVVTMIYVIVGVTMQYLIGLGLAMLCTQQLKGRRFFRIVFLLPMMITPVGVGYLFRMLADTNKGPLVPFWDVIGASGFTWANLPWGARTAVMIGDIWQWTPFMFIVLVAALEAQGVEPIEAAMVDGANSWQIFWNITVPAITPASITLILIRLIEAFKIIDLPNILTNGGPGTATETMTLYAYRIWRATDIGGSAALAYLLLILVTIVATAYATFARKNLSN